MFGEIAVAAEWIRAPTFTPHGPPTVFHYVNVKLIGLAKAVDLERSDDPLRNCDAERRRCGTTTQIRGLRNRPADDRFARSDWRSIELGAERIMD